MVYLSDFQDFETAAQELFKQQPLRPGGSGSCIGRARLPVAMYAFNKEDTRNP